MENLDNREESRLSDKVIKEGVPFAALSYVFFLWILAFIFKRDKNEFVHFHARQGVVIFIGEIICLSALILPLIGPFFCRLGMIILFVISILGIFSAITGKMSHIPLVSNMANKLII